MSNTNKSISRQYGTSPAAKGIYQTSVYSINNRQKVKEVVSPWRPLTTTDNVKFDSRKGSNVVPTVKKVYGPPMNCANKKTSSSIVARA